jgi:dienelactone hydrolase
MQHLLRVLVWLIFAPAIVSTAHASDEALRLRINYLAYPVDWNGKSILIGGRFQAPLNVSGKIPAVIILHDTAGVKENGIYYATALNRAGIATLEIDQWGGRGLSGGASSRPKNPGDNLADVGGAYRLLIAQPEIDAARIGLLGLSLGGIQTMLMMTRRNSDAILGSGNHFRAAVAFYPICWLYNYVPDADFAELVDAKIRILIGSEDDYDDGPGPCEDLLGKLAPSDSPHVSLKVLAGATHIFDSLEGSYEFPDPASHRRKGGTVRVRANPAAREEARDDLVRFFTAALGEK